MKEIKWNIGLLIIKVGYRVRKKFWYIGKNVLWIGFKIRGAVPQKHWSFQNKIE